MVRQELQERTLTVYTGKDLDERPSKDAIGEFIVDTMGLEKADGSPRWSAGVLELVSCGMDRWDGPGDSIDPALVAKVQEQERTIEELRSKNESLKTRLRDIELTHGDPADMQMRTEARILQVLCSDDNLGVDSPNWVPIADVEAELGFKRGLLAGGRVLDWLVNEGYVVDHPSLEKIKASDARAYESYRDSIEGTADVERERKE